jgi:hypothetical protein
MKREMKELEAKIKALRDAVEYEKKYFGNFQETDEVELALVEVEEELDKFRWK